MTKLLTAHAEENAIVWKNFLNASSIRRLIREQVDIKVMLGVQSEQCFSMCLLVQPQEVRHAFVAPIRLLPEVYDALVFDWDEIQIVRCPTEPIEEVTISSVPVGLGISMASSTSLESVVPDLESNLGRQRHEACRGPVTLRLRLHEDCRPELLSVDRLKCG